jgi:hypothetical protein
MLSARTVVWMRAPRRERCQATLVAKQLPTQKKLASASRRRAGACAGGFMASSTKASIAGFSRRKSYWG